MGILECPAPRELWNKKWVRAILNHRVAFDAKDASRYLETHKQGYAGAERLR